MTPGSLVIVTGSPYDSSDPDTVCWSGGEDNPEYTELLSVLKGTLGVVLNRSDNKLRIITDEATTIWIWDDTVAPVA